MKALRSLHILRDESVARRERRAASGAGVTLNLAESISRRASIDVDAALKEYSLVDCCSRSSLDEGADAGVRERERLVWRPDECS